MIEADGPFYEITEKYISESTSCPDKKHVDYNDPMGSSSYVTLANEYFYIYPSALVNRDTYRFGVIQPEANILQFIYEYVREREFGIRNTIKS